MSDYNHDNYNNLLYLQVKKALHGEDLLESVLPSLYQKITSEKLKEVIKQLMDANKKHQDLLDTAALSLSSYSDQEEHINFAIESLLSKLKEISTQEKIQPSSPIIPFLQKIIHQQIASFEILNTLTRQTGYNHLSEDFKGLIEESNRTLKELRQQHIKHYTHEK